MRKPSITPENRFAKAPPGYSLTGTPGKWPWERPPQYKTPSEAVDGLIDNLEKPEIQETYVQLMAAGVSIEELVGTMARVGFMEGKFTVDVAEIIKAPLAMYLMGLATEAEIPAKVFTTKDGLPRENYGMEDAQILNIMRDRNPDFAKFIESEMPRRLGEEKQRRERIQQESFIGVEMPPGETFEGEAVEAEEEMFEDEAFEAEAPEMEEPKE